ncbi:chaperone, ATP12, partial [Elioraea sp. Yellowstone]
RSPVALAALGVAVPALGSLVLGLALAERRIGPEEAHALATLDEAFQAEEWGQDAEAAARLAAIAADVRLAARILALDQPERVA